MSIAKPDILKAQLVIQHVIFRQAFIFRFGLHLQKFKQETFGTIYNLVIVKCNILYTTIMFSETCSEGKNILLL